MQEYIFDINIDQISLEIKTYHNFLVGATQNWIHSRLNSSSTSKWIHSLYLDLQIFIKHDRYQFNNQIDSRKTNLKNMSYPPIVYWLWYQFNNQIDSRKTNLKNMSYPPIVYWLWGY